MENKNFGQYQPAPKPANWMEPELDMSFTEAVKTSFHKYADFEGRARRTEFWYFRLFQIIVMIGFLFLTGVFSVIDERLAIIPVGLLLLFVFATIIPSLASSVRRLHDTGNSGWLLLLDIFCTNGLVMIVMGCIEGNQGTNQYGPNPKTSGKTQFDEFDRRY